MSEKREHIGTTRFNAETWKENIEWREKNGWRGCIYGVPSSMPSSIARGDIVYVIEMNNDTNKIMGIGKINKRHKKYKHQKPQEASCDDKHDKPVEVKQDNHTTQKESSH